MMNFINTPSPQYKGATPAPKSCNGGLLSQLLCYLFGGGTPAYKGNGQPSPKGCGVPGFPGAPAYRAAPVVTSDPIDETSADNGASDVVDLRDASELNGSPQASTPSTPMTKGPITIVIG